MGRQNGDLGRVYGAQQLGKTQWRSYYQIQEVINSD